MKASTNNPPRILALLGNIPLFGQERANIETMHALSDLGCAVRFLIRGEYTKDTIQAELIRRGLEFQPVPHYQAVQHGMPARVWWRNLANIVRGSWQLLSQIRSFKATHIHVGSSAHVLNFVPALALTRLPLIFRAGDEPPMHHVLWRWIWWFTRLRAAMFVCDSKFIQNKLMALGVDKARTCVIYAPAPRRHAATGLDSHPRAFTSPTVLYVGQLSRAKGVDILVETAIGLCHRWPDLRFVVAGDYDWNNPFARGLIEQVQSSGLAQRILFTGYVEDLDAIYSDATLHVCPTMTEEPYGLTVLEAKQRGVASVVFPSGGLTELVTHEVDGRVCTGKSAQALTDAIRTYLDQPGQAALHGQAAQASLRRLEVDQFAYKWKCIYERTRPIARGQRGGEAA